jgi:hypothetical protein
MVAGGITVGAIQVVNKRTGTGIFDEHDRQLPRGTRGQCRLRLRNAQLHAAETGPAISRGGDQPGDHRHLDLDRCPDGGEPGLQALTDRGAVAPTRRASAISARSPARRARPQDTRFADLVARRVGGGRASRST